MTIYVKSMLAFTIIVIVKANIIVIVKANMDFT